MAGHSKWANIKHRKAAVDAKRGKIFSKLIRELKVAAKNSANPEDNPKLRTAIDKALNANMKRETIDKAIQRGFGSGEAENYEEVIYEGYGHSGTAFLVQCLTDNRNRSVAAIRHAFSKFGGNLGTEGSVAYLFDHIGQIVFEEGTSEDTILETALNAGAKDIITHEDGSIEVVTDFNDFIEIKDTLIEAGLQPIFADSDQAASTYVDLDAEATDKVERLVAALEELDDVQNVYTNKNPN